MRKKKKEKQRKRVSVGYIMVFFDGIPLLFSGFLVVVGAAICASGEDDVADVLWPELLLLDGGGLLRKLVVVS